MSWFTDLAGKAEDFLNKVDQGAATALTKNQERSSSFSSSYGEESVVTAEYNTAAAPHHTYTSSHDAPSFISSAAGNIKRSSATLLSGTANVSSGPSGSGSAAPNASKGSSGFVRPKKSEQDEVDDDMLFDFLNSSDPPVSSRRDSRRELVKAAGPFTEAQDLTPPLSTTPHPVPSAPSTPPSTRGVSRTSSMSSLSAHSVKTSEESSAKEQSQGRISTKPAGLKMNVCQPAAFISALRQMWSQILSSLRLENQLLRSEVASLNQEMASVIQRAKSLQDELNQTRLRADRWNSEQAQTDRMLRELRSHVDDLTEALSAKDGQLAVLKIRLDEADQLLKSRSAALDEAQKEKSRIMQDHTEGSSMHNQTIETIQERLRDAELALRREQDNYRQMQSEYAGRLSKVEAERQTLAETVTAAERRAAEEKLRGDEVQQQLKSSKAAAESSKQELQDYKHKASRILQSKEKLISSLKEGSGLETLEGSGSMTLEMEDLRHDKELQREEIQKLQGQVHTLRTEIQDLENQALTEAETWREQQVQLEEQQAAHSRAKQEVEAEVERYKQVRRSTDACLVDVSYMSVHRRSELEKRYQEISADHKLTGKIQLLVSLLCQREFLKKTLLTIVNDPRSYSTNNVSYIPGARQRNTPILFSDQDSPGVYGQVRKAASTIDRFSIRLGIFLRRYPAARVFVILYMAILHLWVMIVLLTYTPEMHHGHPDGR
uniref:Golgin subfamily A member 5 n=1 Tax=Labrus bergylta TaxID=56723 RepID=A0A3Q3MBF0_9LABR